MYYTPETLLNHVFEDLRKPKAPNKDLYANIFTYPTNTLPMKYLGVPIDNKKLSKCLWAPTIEKDERKLGLWRGRFLSMGGRLTLMNSCLTDVPLYMLSIYSAPKSVIRRIGIHRKNFLWQSGRDCKKIHSANWEMVCTQKMQGGLGFLDLNCMNDALLAKWLWSIENLNGLCRKLSMLNI
jgi:hypothetical protein